MTSQDSPQQSTEATSAIILIRIFGLIIMLIGMALVVVPVIIGERSTLSLFAFLFSGVGLVAVGFGLLQLYLWGMYLLLTADILTVISLIITFQTLPLFKSLLIIISLLIAGYFIYNRDLFKRTDLI